MNAPQRMAELTGISDDEESPVGVWPINVALLLVGVVLLVVSFSFLDTADPRPTHNPWTYAVATPLVLMLLSSLLSTFASRLVEKSMQLAFLLSVLIHLLLLVYAVNIVIFSRMWPDMIESLDRQRQQLERQSLMANQYVHLSTTANAGKRPDYLKHAPTEHQPTELEQQLSPTLQMTRNERTNLVSPTPELERKASPHAIERPQPSYSTPISSQRLAELSRSDLQRSRLAEQLQIDSQAMSTATNFDPALTYEAVATPSLQPNESVSARRTRSDSYQRVQLVAPAADTPSAPASADKLQRQIVELQRASEADAASQPTQSTPGFQRRQSSLAAGPATQRLSSPEPLPTPSLNDTRPSPPTADATLGLARRRDASSTATVNPLLDPDTLAAANALPPRMDVQRRQDWQVPQPSSGAQPQRLARDTAGGRSGAPATASMPVRGEAALGSPQPSSDSLAIAPTDRPRRRSSAGRSSASLPNLGAVSGPSWDGTPQLAVGGEGQASLSRRDAGDGQAATEALAGLQGSTRDMQRASIGLPAAQGLVASPSQAAPNGSTSADAVASGLPPTPEAGEIAALEARALNPARRNTTGNSATTLDPFSANTPAAAAGQPAATEATRTQRSTGDLSSSLTDSAVTDALDATSRQDRFADSEASSQARPPMAAATIDLPEFIESNSPSPNSGDALAAGTGKRERRSPSELPNTLAGPLKLDIEADSGIGGLLQDGDLVGPLLARRSMDTPPLAPAQIEAQRFARRDVGGPLAAGQKIAIPKPAFQQRLDRLQDRNPQNATDVAPQTELAIERGLEFLARNQRPDGAWKLQDFDTPVLMRSDTAAIGLALLAFQGAGYTHRQYQYADNVDRALKYLIERQGPDGDLYIRQDPASDQNAWLYSHAIATLALCEAYGMTQDPELRDPAQRAIDFMVASQDPERGGWRYRPGSGSDTSVTGWFMMAFKSGQLADLDVPAESFAGIRKYVTASQVSEETPYLFRYNPFAAPTPQQRHGLQPTAVMTSVGLLMRLYMGWNRQQRNMQLGADHLLEHLPRHGTEINSERDTYYWYYATQVMFHMQGEHWKTWREALYPLMIDNQVQRGEYAGSWDPLSPTPDLWARYGGRLYVTTMNLLSLEVSYRHLPLYEATAQ